MRILYLTVFSCFCCASAAVADQVDYTKDIKPLLRERCFSCHGSLKQKGKLRVDSGAGIRKGGVNGPAVLPGNAAESLLLQRVADPDEAKRMPPEGRALTETQVKLLHVWIEQGAQSPADEKPDTDPGSHWAFRPPTRPSFPEINDADWIRNPVDAFVRAEQEKLGIVQAGPVSKPMLLRRVYLDLIGLPPTAAEQEAFLGDASADAYEKVVDRLLSSPQYGERWGRHWMDVWRYSDWYGRRSVPDVMNSYPQIWRWRDWIVRSLNADKGYHSMVQEMLAADELAPTDDANLVATGFLVRNWYKWNYNQWQRDLVEHTGKAFLGITLNCCHCHDHKYDPFSQKDYFAFRACFEPLELRHDRVPGEADPGPFKKYVYAESYGPIQSGMVRVFDEKLDAETYMYAGGDERNRILNRPPVPPAPPAALGGTMVIEPVHLPTSARYPGMKPFVREEELSRRQQEVTAAETSLRMGNVVAPSRLTAAKSELAAFELRLAADDVLYGACSGNAAALVLEAGHAERQAALDKSRFAYEMVRQTGSAQEAALAEKQVSIRRADLGIPSKSYSSLGPLYPRQSTGRRLALARWITDRANPLAARVAVNHIWARHFGRPLVESMFDFGHNGKAPSNPALLDWLAVEFMDSGWSMKHLHRLLVTSNAYRVRSSGPGSDRDGRLLASLPIRRLDAEQVRDSVLWVSGKLDARFGGKEIPHEQGLSSTRRSLYFAQHGEGAMQFLELFDGVNPCDGYQRTISVLPQQALALVNNELVLDASRTLGRAFADVNEADFIRIAFTIVLGRTPSDAETRAARGFLNQQAELLRSSNQPDPQVRARSNFYHVLFNHNDFVTIR